MSEAPRYPRAQRLLQRSARAAQTALWAAGAFYVVRRLVELAGLS